MVEKKITGKQNKISTLVLIDESGDSGFKLNKGSSRYFAIGMVVFDDMDEALACDQRIELLKRELGWINKGEFHFKHNSHTVKQAFLKAVAPYNFFYYGFVLNKNTGRLWGEGFKNKSSFYKYACGLVFENAKDKLTRATVVVDKSGGTEFRSSLAKYLKTKMNSDTYMIRKVKLEKSHSNNLIQLADYVAGVINRSVQNKKYGDLYRKIISHREIRVQIWPQ